MLQGEQATLFYTDLKKIYLMGPLNFGVTLPYKVKTVMFQIVLTSEDKPITGFKGMTLRQEMDEKDIETFYSAGNNADPNSSNGRACGSYTSFRDLLDGSEAKCDNFCFRSYDDLAAQKNAVACDSGEARWIVIFTAGTLRQGLGMSDADKAFAKAVGTTPGYNEHLAAANYLVVHAMWKGSSSVHFPIDNTFRAALWGDAPGQQ